MKIACIDHIVLTVADGADMVRFYASVLGMAHVGDQNVDIVAGLVKHMRFAG